MYKIIFTISLFIILNCASSSAGMTTSNIPVVDKKYKVIAPVEKKSSWWVFDIGILAAPFSKPPLEELLEEMISDNKADALINIRYWQDRSIIFCFTRHRIGVSAEAVKFEEETNVAPAKKLVSLSLIFFLFHCLGAAGGNRNMGINHVIPSATIIRYQNYKVLGKSEGETSTFFFFGLFPATNPLNIEYAMSQAVQKIPGGDSMVNIVYWKETHNIFPLGSISVLKVQGDVVSLKQEETPEESKETKVKAKKVK